jgi:hypothetical protein
MVSCTDDTNGTGSYPVAGARVRGVEMLSRSETRIPITNYGTEHYPRGHHLCSHSTSKNFMNPESSLQHPQKSSTASYPEPDQSNP